MKFIKTEKDTDGSRSISLLLFIGSASHKNSMWTPFIFSMITGFGSIAYLGYFSVLKFRRVKKESDQFEKMQKTFKELSDEEKRRLHNAMANEKAFLEGKPEAGTLEHELDFLALQRSIRQP